VFSQYEYEEVSIKRFIYSIREYRVIAGLEDSVAQKIDSTSLDSTWTTFIEDSVQVSSEIELAVLLPPAIELVTEDSVQVSSEIEIPVLLKPVLVLHEPDRHVLDATEMKRIVSEAYANEMFTRLIENNSKFKEFCLKTSLPESLILCKTRYTENDSYYVFTIFIK
jgi:hypothetical protein